VRRDQILAKLPASLLHPRYRRSSHTSRTPCCAGFTQRQGLSHVRFSCGEVGDPGRPSSCST